MYAPLSEYTPQCAVDYRPLMVWSAVAVIALALMAAIVGAPIALAGGHKALAFTIYSVFSHLCHQLSERSFFIAGHQFAVCARCTGLYAGFTASTLAYPLMRSLRRVDTPARRWLFVAAAPLAIDFWLGFFGIWENTHLSRFVTGALLGAVAVLYILPGLVDLSLGNWKPVRLGARTSRPQ